MAITYHAGRRIQGLEYTAPNITKDEDFSDVWSTVGSNITITGGAITASSMTTQSENRIYKPLGFTIADDFVIEFEFEETAISHGAHYILFTLTAGNGNINSGTNQDAIQVWVDKGSPTFYLRDKDGTSTGSNTSALTISNSTRYYVTLVNNNRTVTYTVRTGSHTGTVVGTNNITLQSGISGLNHVQSGSMTGNSGTASYTLDNLKIWNNTTSSSGTPTYTGNFSSASVWISANPTYTSVNASTEKLDFDWDNSDGSSDKQMRYDLTSVATNWILRFKLNWSALTASSNAYMYVGLTDNVGGTSTSQSGFMLRFINAAPAGSQYVDFGVNQVNSTLPYNLGGNGVANMVYTTGKDFYVEMKKDGTTLTGTVFENSDYTGVWSTATQTITTTITPSLRYLHFWNSMSANTGAWTGTIDDVEFYNDITTAIPTAIGDEKPTNIQIGSRFEETDTRKMYSYNEPDFNKTDCVGYYTLDEASGNPTNHVTTSNGFTDIPTETIYYLSHGHDSTGRHFVKKVGSTVTTMTESDYINLKGALTESHKGSQTSALPSAWSGMWQGSTSAINGHDWYAISFSTDTNSPANGSSGATQNVTGKFDKCFEFSGGNNEQVGLNGTVLADYYNPSNHASTTHKSDFTISCWINHDNDNGNYPMLVSNYTGSNTGGFQFYINGTANTVTFWTSTNDVTASGALSSGSWHHVVCMRESGTVKFYINGSLNSSTIANAHHIEGLVDCAIGGKTDGGNGLNGKIDEVSIWRRALSASEISALYNSGTGKTLLEAKQAKEWQEIGT